MFVWQQEDLWHTKVSDVRSQLRFLEEVESLKKKRKDEEERERLLRLARVSLNHSYYYSMSSETKIKLRLACFYGIKSK